MAYILRIRFTKISLIFSLLFFSSCWVTFKKNNKIIKEELRFNNSDTSFQNIIKSGTYALLDSESFVTDIKKGFNYDMFSIYHLNQFINVGQFSYNQNLNSVLSDYNFIIKKDSVRRKTYYYCGVLKKNDNTSFSIIKQFFRLENGVYLDMVTYNCKLINDTTFGIVSFYKNWEPEKIKKFDPPIICKRLPNFPLPDTTLSYFYDYYKSLQKKR